MVYTLQDTQSTAPAQASYLAQAFSGWPQAWHPVLQQAPAGAIGSLWSADRRRHARSPMSGSGWTPCAAAQQRARRWPWTAAPTAASMPSRAARSSSWTRVAVGRRQPHLALPCRASPSATPITSGSRMTRALSTGLRAASLPKPPRRRRRRRQGQSRRHAVALPRRRPARLPLCLRRDSIRPKPIALGQGVTSVTKVAGTCFGTG